MTDCFDPALPFAKPLLPDLNRVKNRIQGEWERGMVTKGPLLAEYEKAVSEYLGVKRGVAVSSCTTGLILTLQSLGLQGKCLVSAFTFTATVQAILWNRLTPVFVDCDAKRFTIDLKSLEAAYSSDIKAVVATYIFGNPPPLKSLSVFCKERRVPLIVDAAHGFGAQVYGKPPGHFGIAEVFSSSPTKLLCTGEGGFIATHDERIKNAMESLREYGHGQDYETVRLGLNGRMPEFSAAMGLEALPLLAEHAKRRAVLVHRYRETLKKLPVSFQEIEPECQSSNKDFAVILEDGWEISRDEIAAQLEKRGIPVRKYFSPPLHLQNFFKSRSEVKGTLPNTEKICSRILCLPIYYDLTGQDIEKIGSILTGVYDRQKQFARER